MKPPGPNEAVDLANPSPSPDVGEGLKRMTRRGFATAGIVMAVGFGGWRWLVGRSADEGLPWPLRRILQANERLARATFGPTRLAPDFTPSRARTPRVNGVLGMTDDDDQIRQLDPAAWRLEVEGPGGSRSLHMDAILSLPRVEQTTELKCIEGWSTVVHWAGARLADLAASTGLASRSGQPSPIGQAPTEPLAYVSLATPDGSYYVGLDLPSALHPQTLLAYEMNGRPLSPAHGAPLRLVVPVKYGIKHIKQIGRVRFTDQRPADYWAERGYDWYSGH